MNEHITKKLAKTASEALRITGDFKIQPALAGHHWEPIWLLGFCQALFEHGFSTDEIADLIEFRWVHGAF